MYPKIAFGDIRGTFLEGEGRPAMTDRGDYGELQAGRGAQSSQITMGQTRGIGFGCAHGAGSLAREGGDIRP